MSSSRVNPRVLGVAAVVLVAFVVLVVVVGAVRRSNNATAVVYFDGLLCVHTDGRVWTSTGTLAPPASGDDNIVGHATLADEMNGIFVIDDGRSLPIHTSWSRRQAAHGAAVACEVR